MSTNDKSDAWLLYFRYGYGFFKPTDRRDRLFVLATLVGFVWSMAMLYEIIWSDKHTYLLPWVVFGIIPFLLLVMYIVSVPIYITEERRELAMFLRYYTGVVVFYYDTLDSHEYSIACDSANYLVEKIGKDEINCKIKSLAGEYVEDVTYLKQSNDVSVMEIASRFNNTYAPKIYCIARLVTESGTVKKSNSIVIGREAK